MRPLGPPAGILHPWMSMSYGQGIFPTLNYPSWGSTTGYNFDPMTGQPLRPSIPSSYPFLSQLLEMLLSTSLDPSLADLLALLDADDEESPLLVVEPPAHSSHVVTGRTVPTITVSSSVVETTLSASPRSSPRVSTSSTSAAGKDVQRVIQHHLPTSAKTALVRSGVGQGSVIVKELMRIAGIGKGCPGSLSNAPRETRKQEGDKRHVDAGVSANLLPLIVMKLDPQGPPVSYAEAASRPPQRKGVT